MKYYVLVIANGDSKIKGKSVYEYDNLHDATASYHAELSKGMKSDLYSDVLVMVINSEGGVHETSKEVGKYVEPIAEEVTEE